MKNFVLVSWSCAALVAAALVTPADALLLCAKVDKNTGLAKDGSPVKLRSVCKVKGDGTPVEVAVGSTEELAALPPAGTIIASARPWTEAPPEGWLKCDGSALDADDYPELWQAIGTTHGNATSVATGGLGCTPGADCDFNLPDYRGRFLRGANEGASGGLSRDVEANVRSEMNPGGAIGDAVGSLQLGATRLPNNPFRISIREGLNDPGDGSVACMDRSNVCQNLPANVYTVFGGDSQTRPVNAAVTYYIKY